jgi:hypothetical protein
VTTRGAAIEKAWRARKREKSYKGICPFCSEPIWVGGVKVGDQLYHRSCAERKKIIETREKYAVRGYYAD